MYRLKWSLLLSERKISFGTLAHPGSSSPITRRAMPVRVDCDVARVLHALVDDTMNRRAVLFGIGGRSAGVLRVEATALKTHLEVVHEVPSDPFPLHVSPQPVGQLDRIGCECKFMSEGMSRCELGRAAFEELEVQEGGERLRSRV